MTLERFAWRVAHARTVGDLACCLMEEGHGLTGASRLGLYLFGADGAVDLHTRNIPASVLEHYESVGRRHDPVLAEVRRMHAPSEASFAEMRANSRARAVPDSYRALIERVLSIANRGHYLVAPIVVDGAVAGTLNFARTDDRGFGAHGVAMAHAVSLHVSSRLATLRAQAEGVDPSWREVLTPRGLEVAELAARGLTMAEVGRMLGVSANTAKKHLRMVYERMAIGSRAELASALAGRRPTVTRSRAGAR